MKKFILCFFVLMLGFGTNANAQQRQHKQQQMKGGEIIALGAILVTGVVVKSAIESNARVKVAKARAEASKPQVIVLENGDKVVFVNGQMASRTTRVSRSMTITRTYRTTGASFTHR